MSLIITGSVVFGREVRTNETIFKHETVCLCELLVLNSVDTKIVNTTGLEYYTFKYSDDQDCLVLGHGEIFNHSDTPNVKYELIDFYGRKVMKFTATTDISIGEQLFIDYNLDVQVDTTSYVNKNLV